MRTVLLIVLVAGCGGEETTNTTSTHQSSTSTGETHSSTETGTTSSTGETSNTETTQRNLPFNVDCLNTTDELTGNLCLDAAPCRFDFSDANGYMGFAAASQVDLSGDGYVEIAVSGPTYLDAGEVMIFSGAAISTGSAGFIGSMEGQSGEYLGYSLAMSSDINGDGSADLLAGAPRYSGVVENGGRVLLTSGINDGLEPAVVFTASTTNGQIGTALASGGDMNGDGLSEVLINGELFDDTGSYYRDGGVYLVMGSPKMPAEVALEESAIWVPGESYSAAGLSMTFGDFNDDGYDDAAVGAPYGNSYYGRVYVINGGPDTPSLKSLATADLILTGASYYDLFGWLVAAGDLTGDGVDDLAVGSPTASYSWDYSGAVTVFDGQAGLKAINSYYGEFDDHQLGSGLAMADINNDGISDLLVGAVAAHKNLKTKSGRSYAIYGGGTLPSSTAIETAALTQVYGANTNDYIGRATLGTDINLDGATDLIVASGYTDYEDTADSGSLFILFGTK